MNIKQRFALLFTSFVAIILAISCTVIYILYASYREEDYYNRIFIEGSDVYSIFNELKGANETVPARFIQEVHDKTLVNEKLFITDKFGRVVFKMPDSIAVNIPNISTGLIKKTGVYRYTDETDVQHVVIHFPNSGMFVYTSGFDRVGLRKLATLKVILGAVFGGALFLTAIMSFLFVNEAIKPIVRLSLQMKKTTEQNLGDRIEVPEARDELSQIAKNFNAMLERLRKAFMFQKNFVHHASHELRTPLAVMLAQTESALNKKLSESDYIKVLTSLREDQQQMIELTNSLLLISQYEKLDFSDDWPSIRIDELLYDVVEAVKRNVEHIEVIVSFAKIPDSETMLSVKGSDSLLRAACMNLLKNAEKYSSDHLVAVTIEPTGKNLLISFDNFGKQLTALEAEKLMVPFFRGENAQGKKGFGLGLSIVQRVISLHGGEVRYQALDNGINRFSVTLPTIAGA